MNVLPKSLSFEEAGGEAQVILMGFKPGVYFSVHSVFGRLSTLPKYFLVIVSLKLGVDSRKTGRDQVRGELPWGEFNSLAEAMDIIILDARKIFALDIHDWSWIRNWLEYCNESCRDCACHGKGVLFACRAGLSRKDVLMDFFLS